MARLRRRSGALPPKLTSAFAFRHLNGIVALAANKSEISRVGVVLNVVVVAVICYVNVALNCCVTL